MSILIDVADAVKEKLNTTDWGIAFKAERVHGKQNKTLEQLKELVVEVVPRMSEPMLSARGTIGYLATIDIFMRRKMGPPDQEIATGAIDKDSLDPLTTLAETIAETFMPKQSTRTGRLTGYDHASWKESKIMTGPITDLLSKTRVWQAQIRLVFKVV